MKTRIVTVKPNVKRLINRIAFLLCILALLTASGGLGDALNILQYLPVNRTETSVSVTATSAPLTATSTTTPEATFTLPVPTGSATYTATVDLTPSPVFTPTMTASATLTPSPTAIAFLTYPLSVSELEKFNAIRAANNCPSPKKLGIKATFVSVSLVRFVSNDCLLAFRNYDGLDVYKLGEPQGESKWIDGEVTYVFYVDVIKGEVAVVAPKSAFRGANGNSLVEYGQIIGEDTYVHIQALPRLIPTSTSTPNE